MTFDLWSASKFGKQNMNSDTQIFDLFVVGGGINGCGIARDAAGRGYSVALVEMNDLASATSSGSTKLIHGGLRYLEHYAFRLVREALQEREVLWSMAPHIIRPLRFVLPHRPGMRPAWMLRLGLFLYDVIGGRRSLPGTRRLNLSSDEVGEPLKPGGELAFEYSDCWVDDARLVVLNARDAEDRGAKIMTRTKLVSAEHRDGIWHVTTQSADGGTSTYQARMLVNAAGPWVDDVLATASGGVKGRNVRLVQGSHIITPRLFDHDRCYIFQNDDGRIVFAIPYEGDFTLVGTTDRDFQDDPSRVAISEEETDYLLGVVNANFQRQITAQDVVWSYSAVRPLYDDGASKAQEATRDYVLKLDETAPDRPLLSVFGGKITTYRRLAESALEIISSAVGEKGAPWTDGSTLPGGDFGTGEFEQRLAELRETYPFLSTDYARQLLRFYGTEAGRVLDGAGSMIDLGPCFGSNLTAREVDYLMDREWARVAEDVLWRRSKLGLRMTPEQVAALEAYMADQLSGVGEVDVPLRTALHHV